MRSIQVLPIHLVNKIAAGEVIERPASVVKELLENALDAGATRIDLAVEDGGRRLIQVSDNGSGMGADDLALAFAPHATSKIASEDDLFGVTTMGFRGEALASIGAVAHARIVTRRADDEGGSEVQAAGETAHEVRPCAAAPGTTVTVRDLFFNTPARRKFMRTANTELGHVVEQLTRLALPHPHVAFTLTHNGREVKNLPAAESTRQRAGDLWGQELAGVLLPVARRGGKVVVDGLVAPPAAGRATSKWQYFFLNGRYIRDRLLSHALREAFRGRIEPNRWPVALLFVQMDPAEVDVNVHPTKIEVRFQNTQLVHGELLAALKETLNRADLSPTAVARAAPAALDAPAIDAAGAPADEQRRASLREALADFFKSVPPPQPRLSFPESLAARPATHRDEAAAPPAPPARPAPLMDRAGRFPPTPPEPHREGEDRAAAPVPPAAIQVHNTYIVAPCDDGLIIIDQHALHERLLYNEIRDRLAAGRLAGQRLLIPATVQVTAAEADMLQRQEALLGRLGIEAAAFGPGTVAVQQFPTLLAERGVSPAAFLRELVDRLAEDETTDSERLLEKVLSIMACKAAVKAGDPLKPSEIDSLLARASQADKPSACPHGRPTTLRLSLADLEKQFGRT